MYASEEFLNYYVIEDTNFSELILTSTFKIGFQISYILAKFGISLIFLSGFTPGFFLADDGIYIDKLFSLALELVIQCLTRNQFLHGDRIF